MTVAANSRARQDENAAKLTTALGFEYCDGMIDFSGQVVIVTGAGWFKPSVRARVRALLGS